ncbi:hypothetical protein BB560_004965 [Smittium megazygosporum]|uniref:Sodium/potassium exporting P-type ATPase 1 n=1 Tax=Smittium megazygosporum TaxID=133381 RepID=A0A2T9Z7S7_9FUNG|nr:hypothetical protein BB560_004965 [Smittium megazygosporum]
MSAEPSFTDYHTLTSEEALQRLEASASSGLSDDQVSLRLATYGENALVGENGVSALKVLIAQFTNVLVVILAAASALSFAVKDFAEATVILLVLFINAAIGFFQEYKAEKTVESLKKMTSPNAQVLRNGTIAPLPTSELVPGDIILLTSGDVVGADCRLLETINLETDEALLTGEALPIHKDYTTVCKTDDSVGDRFNLVYSSTTVTKGRGRAVVYATGMSTEVGKIAKKLMAGNKKRKTKLAKSLDKMALVLLAVAIVLAIIVFAANRFKINSEVILYAVSLAIAVIPEGLVAIVTLTMAIGMRRMSKQKALVRQLNSIEILGSVTDICSDKTGTLTQSKMVLVRAFIPSNELYHIDGLGLEPIGNVYKAISSNESDSTINRNSKAEVLVEDSNMSPSLELLVKGASLCNNAVLKYDNETGEWSSAGDPTETALQVFATKLQHSKEILVNRQGYKILYEYPFDSGIKRMTVIAQSPDGTVFAFLKGATEKITECCTQSPLNPEIGVNSSSNLYSALEPHIESMAADGLRVISIAYKIISPSELECISSNTPREQIEQNFNYIGMVGIYDPPRPESRDSVIKCHQAGIVVRMLTGDHPATATAIAKQVAIIQDSKRISDKLDSTSVGINNLVMVARDFDAMTIEQIDALPELPVVIARCTPETKVKLIEALHRRKAVVAMTGDGVNDSPSLKYADVGIAMGMAGSDVAKQASAIILTDDNFATIVRAVAEGRRMFSNIAKFATELIGSNVAELVCLTVGLAFRDLNGRTVFPLSPVAILANNMLTGTPPAMALGVERALPENMTNPPRDPAKGLFTWEVVSDIIVQGAFIGGISITCYWLRLDVFGDGNLGSGCNIGYNPSCDTVFKARGVNFACLTLMILNFAYSCRDTRRQTLSIPMLKRVFENRGLVFSYLLAWVITMIALYVPKVNTSIFKQHYITWEWSMVFIAFIVQFIFDAIYKYLKQFIFPPTFRATQSQLLLQKSSQGKIIEEK